MAIYIQLKGALQIREDNKAVFNDTVIIEDTYTEYDVRKVTVVHGTTDEVIDLSHINNVKFVYIKCSLPMTFKLNYSAVETSEGTVFMFTGNTAHPITSITCSNANTDNVQMQIILGG